MSNRTGQPLTASLRYEKIILSAEKTTSGGGCGSLIAAFLCPASACQNDRVPQGFFVSQKDGGYTSVAAKRPQLLLYVNEKESRPESWTQNWLKGLFAMAQPNEGTLLPIVANVSTG